MKPSYEIKSTRNKISFSYSGELSDCRKLVLKELVNKESDEKRKYLKYAYEKAKKEYERYEDRCKNLRACLQMIDDELSKKEVGE